MKILSHLIYDCFRLVKKSEWLFILFNRIYLPSQLQHIIVQKHYNFCIYAYPSSANTYLYYYIKKALQPDTLISHHMHSPAMIRRALRLGVPVFVIIREPLEAIASYYSRFSRGKTFSLHTAIKSYTDFYRTVKRNISQITLFSFRTATQSPGIILALLAKEQNTVVTVPSALQKNTEYITSVKQAIKTEGVLLLEGGATALPSKEIQVYKSRIYNEIKKNPEFLKAMSLYNALSAYTYSSKPGKNA